ncbi:enolase C-terminal domain-like protein [Delftia sp. PS-11]|uniref:enolase C-terminal domain-like protein n=1 Tax=Delftia sp. PS-11 TaxID=2767222 RepID=UPI002453E8A7|nr:enolase C-terminal domain-like protein [Delftia sp. PS-11]KAJ8744073.1 fuconate dehydratase [Delftia sp. PS-11]
MSITIQRLSVRDIRFPTSRSLDGSDAMNAAPDYSAAYVVLHTDAGPELQGHGLTFTIGRGNELCVQAVQSLQSFVVGHTLEELTADMGALWRRITSGDSQLRWVGPDKGVIHLATAAIVNALWDLWGKSQGKPVWKLLSDMTPEQLVRCLDFRYVTDVLTPDEAIALLRRLARECVAQGWTHFKQKVGADLQDDLHRAAILREEIGWERTLMMDANQVWEVDEAVECVRRLAAFDPWWIEEPTSPDDILGHAAIRRRIAPIGVATGEHCHNRVMFKQLLQAGAIDFCQIDAARLGGLNEVLLVLLMAAKSGVPVCPHAGGVGLCEYVQHIALFDYIGVSASLERRVLEYVDHLHEHFLDPVTIRSGRYMPPMRPGYSIEMHAASLQAHEFPHGTAWA